MAALPHPRLAEGLTSGAAARSDNLGYWVRGSLGSDPAVAERHLGVGSGSSRFRSDRVRGRPHSCVPPRCLGHGSDCLWTR